MAWKCESVGYQGAIYQKEWTLSDQPILLRRSAKFGPMEPQSSIFWTILASGNTVATTDMQHSSANWEKWELIDQSNSWKDFVYLFFSTFAEACAALHWLEKSLSWKKYSVSASAENISYGAGLKKF